MRNMKVLILTSKFGMGHLSASNSLAEEIEDLYFGSEAVVEDIFEYIMPEYTDTMYKAFNVLVNKGSKLYNLFYRFTENGKIDSTPFVFEHFLKKLDELLDEIKPTVIISTFPFCSQLVSKYKDKTGDKRPLLTCITDLSSHSEWLSKNTDCYLVADEYTKDELIEKGIDVSKILVTGIPVRREFKNTDRKDKIQNEKNILIMGGGLGLLPKLNKFYEDLNNLEGVKTTVITGNNEKMYYKLHSMYENIEVLGYTDHVDKYMENADLIITKPGGITLFETIHSELPLLVFSPFLLHEINNAAFILDKNIGRVLSKNPKEHIDNIKEIIYDNELLNTFKKNLKSIKDDLDDFRLIEMLDYLESEAQGECTRCI
jgi:processive 1,2-diacylglycerol beta-glucosyltransferase